MSPVCVFAGSAGGQQVIISEHGAIGDGKTVNTKAIQSAIDDCAKSGGGTIVVPVGTFVTGSIFLKQGVNLRVEKDGVLKGSPTRMIIPGSIRASPGSR